VCTNKYTEAFEYRLVCRKDVMANEIAGFDVLKKTNLVILSELTV
jgi:hypothetical protein